MQYSKGNKPTELASVTKTVINVQPFKNLTTSSHAGIAQVEKNTIRNLLVRLVTYNVMNDILLSQETKNITQEYVSVKSTNIGSIVIPESEKRKYPYISWECTSMIRYDHIQGLYIIQS